MTPEEFVQSVLTQTRHMSRPVYRGQGDSSWTLRSSAVRRLLKAHGNELLEDEDELRERVNEYHKDRLIEPMEALECVFHGSRSLSPRDRGRSFHVKPVT